MSNPWTGSRLLFDFFRLAGQDTPFRVLFFPVKTGGYEKSGECVFTQPGDRRSTKWLRSEQAELTGHFDAEVLVGEAGSDASAWGTVEEADLDEEGLVDLFERILFFGQRSGAAAKRFMSVPLLGHAICVCATGVAASCAAGPPCVGVGPNSIWPGSLGRNPRGSGGSKAAGVLPFLRPVAAAAGGGGKAMRRPTDFDPPGWLLIVQT